MRLLEILPNSDFRLTAQLFDDAIPRYAILSHTWGDDEVTFEEMIEDSGRGKAGYDKIRFCGEQAARDSLQYFWVDSCCIDKTNHVELSESINSMFRWYKNAAKCYVYLSDVSLYSQNGKPNIGWDSAFRNSRWFTRGWTLQELLAPGIVEFYSRDKVQLGDRQKFELKIAEITRIPLEALRGQDLSNFSVEERFLWVDSRQTTKKEDKAYCLLGIFGIFLPLIYGEGESNAMRRLHNEIESFSSNERQLIRAGAHNIQSPRNQSFIGKVPMRNELAQGPFIDTTSRVLAAAGLGTVSSIWSSYSTARAFKQKFGEWADEAVDNKGRWLQPVLRSKAFENHLVREKAYFQPTGRCESSFAWAQLLFALNIRPREGVLTWRLPPRDVHPTVSSDISLEVDGDVMCHIINLYRLYNDAAPKDRSHSLSRQYRFSFGRLSLDQFGGDFVATFEPGTNHDLSTQRVPFSHDFFALDYFFMGEYLRFDKEALVAKYFNTLRHQISDTAAIGDLPNPKDPMKKRADYFLRSRKMLLSAHQCDDSCEKYCFGALAEIPDWSRPKLVTQKRMEQASRIKRRVTSNGGEDRGLIDHIIASLKDRPDFIPKDGDFTMTWKDFRSSFESRFLFLHQQVNIYWSSYTLSDEYGEVFVRRAMLELPSIIERLAEKPKGSWLYELSDMVPEVVEMLRTNHSLDNVPVIVLELGPDHDIWLGSCEIKGH